MDAKGASNGYFEEDFAIESSLEVPHPSSKTACFDCNICLEHAADPVVSLCGHLYCWPCIFRWLHLYASPRHCPVCKSPLAESALVPLYGRGGNGGGGGGIPDRPRARRDFASPAPRQGVGTQRRTQAGSAPVGMHQSYHFYGNGRVNRMGVLHSTAGALLGEMAFAVLPWAFRSHELNGSVVISGRNQRWMHQLWLLLLCCAFLCLVLF